MTRLVRPVRPRALGRILALVALRGALLLAPVQAQPLQVVISGAGECPAPAAVARALSAALPAVRVFAAPGAARGEVGGGGGERSAGEEPGGAAVVEAAVADEGQGFSVRVTPRGGRGGPSERRFRDPARRCQERARGAAVFLALNLPEDDAPRGAPAAITPPGVATSPAVAPPAPSPAPAVAPPALSPAPAVAPPPAVASPPASAARSLTLMIELLAVVQASADPAAGAPGGAARIVLGHERRPPLWLGAGLGILATVPLTLTLPPRADSALPALSLWRLPIDLSFLAAWTSPGRRLLLGGEVGLSLALLRLRALAPAAGEEQSRLSPGLRLGLRAALALGRTPAARVALVVQLDTTTALTTYALVLDPLGEVGATPRLALGAGLGLAVRIF